MRLSCSSVWLSPVLDHEFRHNTVKVAVDPRGDLPLPIPIVNIFTLLFQFLVKALPTNTKFKVAAVWKISAKKGCLLLKQNNIG